MKKANYIRTTFYLKPELKDKIKQQALKQRRTITETFNTLIEYAFTVDMIVQAGRLPEIPEEERAKIFKEMWDEQKK
jgi:hypothetical protein